MSPTVTSIPNESIEFYTQNPEPVNDSSPSSVNFFGELVIPKEFVFIFNLEMLVGSKHDLRNDLKILIECTEEGFVAYYKPLELYGFGDDLMEAIEELQADIIDLYEELKNTPENKLGRDPKIWKYHLKEIITDKK